MIREVSGSRGFALAWDDGKEMVMFYTYLMLDWDSYLSAYCAEASYYRTSGSASRRARACFPGARVKEKTRGVAEVLVGMYVER